MTNSIRRWWTINSENIPIKKLNLDRMSVFYTDRELSLPKAMVDESRLLIAMWVKVFPRENTWVRIKLEIPSLIIRFDATINEEGKLQIYEIEERPAGIGIARVINNKFKEVFDRTRMTWPEVKVVLSPIRGSFDDHLWTSVIKKNDVRGKVLVRATREEKEFYFLENMAISSLKFEGDKTYGEKLGLWKKVYNQEELPWEKSFVLKPIRGTTSKDIFIFIPKRLRKKFSTSGSKKPGHTISRIISEIDRRQEGMYCQFFYPPIETGIKDAKDKWKWTILRYFFAYNIIQKSWEYLGGFWNARGSLKIHGASDTLWGPLF